MMSSLMTESSQWKECVSKQTKLDSQKPVMQALSLLPLLFIKQIVTSDKAIKHDQFLERLVLFYHFMLFLVMRSFI